MRDNRWTWVALFLLAVAGLVLFLLTQFPGTLQAQGEQASLVHSVVLLAAIGCSVILGWRGRASLALKQALAWLAIGLGLVVIYTLRDDFAEVTGRVASNIAPTVAIETRDGVVSLGQDRSGHYVVDAAVNGTHVRFLIDTGATHISLSEYDARRVGFDPAELNYTIPYKTANGIAYGAPVMIDEVSVGSISVHNVRGNVSGGGLEQSLLGMSFLNQLSSFEVADGRLILRQ